MFFSSSHFLVHPGNWHSNSPFTCFFLCSLSLPTDGNPLLQVSHLCTTDATGSWVASCSFSTLLSLKNFSHTEHLNGVVDMCWALMCALSLCVLWRFLWQMSHSFCLATTASKICWFWVSSISWHKSTPTPFIHSTSTSCWDWAFLITSSGTITGALALSWGFSAGKGISGHSLPGWNPDRSSFEYSWGSSLLKTNFGLFSRGWHSNAWVKSSYVSFSPSTLEVWTKMKTINAWSILINPYPQNVNA